MKTGLALALAVALSGMWSALGLAEAPRQGQNGAPTQEEHAAYFSTPEPAVTDADKKKADALRLTTIDSIEKLLKTKMPAERKFELYLRQGELFSERHDYLRELEMTDYDKSYEKWQKSGQKGKEPSLSTKASKVELVKAANAFRKLVQEYPKHPRTDAALYALAKTLGRLGNENSVLYFNQLIKSYPKSPLIPDAHLALGEYYFDRNQVEKAMDSYKAAMKYKDNKVYPYAVYKLGWAYYNAKSRTESDRKQNVAKSLAAFKLVVKLSDKDRERRRLNLKREAINDLVMVWAETENVRDAWVYFRNIGENEAFYDLLEKLGGIYVENGENVKAIAVYQRLLKEAPTRPRNPEIYAKVVQLHEQTSQIAEVVKDLRVMATLYAAESNWTRANRQDKSLLDDAKDRTEKNIHRYGALFHNRGHKEKNNPLLAAASEIYKLYLDNFPNTESAYELRYYLADIYFLFKRYEQAADEYTKVANAKPKDGKYLKDSALNAVVAINKVDADTKYPKLPPAGQVSQPMQLPPVKQKLVSVIDNYVRLLPDEKVGQPMRFTAAQIYFDYGHYGDAIERFEKIAMEIPKTKQGEASLKMVFGFYTERKDWEQVIARSRKYLGSKAIVAAGHSPLIVSNLKNGMFQHALALEKNKKYDEAAKLFVAFQSEFSDDTNSSAALYNASLNFYRVADVESAIESGKKVLKLYPNSKVVPNIIVDIAQTYEALAEFDSAAQYYNLFATRYTDDKRAVGALFNSATLYKGLNKYQTSVDLYRDFIKRYPKDALVDDAYYEIAALKEKQKDYKEAIKAYTTFAKRVKNQNDDRVLFSKAKAAELNYLYVDRKDGQRDIDAMRAMLSQKGAPPAFEARRIVASVMFNDLESEFKSFKDMRVASAQSIEKDVAAKQGRLERLAKQYERVIDVSSGEYTVASLYRLGEMHENFAAELFSAPAPAGANQVQLDQFRSSIEKVAFPLKEEAFKFFETAYNRSREVETFTEWTKRTYQKMVELAPEKHPDVLEKSASPAYLAHEMQWESAIANIAE